MIVRISQQQMPGAAASTLYTDYLEGKACAFYPYGPHDLGAALAGRSAYTYPRNEVVALVRAYNTTLGASTRAFENIAALGDPGTMCVITGQQAGLLGGPAYTAHKIATTIRLAAQIEASYERRCIPMFWLASEDHDFGEINHAYLIQADGEIGRIGFGWAEKGRPIAALAVDGRVRRAFEAYWTHAAGGPYLDETREQFAPHADEGYTAWSARVWSELFAEQGLVIVEPRTIRPCAGAFFERALQRCEEIQRRLDRVSRELTRAGYVPQIRSESAGQLYTFDREGYRVRVEDPERYVQDAAARPERYSTDAALRPLLVDTMLPVVASVLGPGEIAYQGMLRPLYELFEVPQPHLYPRKSYTLVGAGQVARLSEYGTTAQEILQGGLAADEAMARLVPVEERAVFETAERAIAAALEPVRSHLVAQDLRLGRTMAQHVARAQRGLSDLKWRAYRACLQEMGYSRGELRALQNALLPRGRLQERVLPLPHFMMRHGRAVLDVLLSAGDLEDYQHNIVVLDGDDG
jgi:bacillithiol biosynthesis cysteine-adding enzyme BshC